MTEPKTEQAVPEKPTPPSSDLTPVFVHSATLLRGTEIPLWVHTADSNYPLIIMANVDSGATGQFIEIKYIQSNNFQVQYLPRAILVYNVDGTPKKAGHITEAVYLIVHYKDHCK